MENNATEYKFTAKVYHYSVSADMTGWTIVTLPQAISVEIRDRFKCMEQGWGRMKVTARIGGSEWQTSIWFDTKQAAYLLPIKAAVRKKENIETDKDAEIVIRI